MKNLPLAEIIDMIIKIIKFLKRKKTNETKTHEQEAFKTKLQEELRNS